MKLFKLMLVVGITSSLAACNMDWPDGEYCPAQELKIIYVVEENEGKYYIVSAYSFGIRLIENKEIEYIVCKEIDKEAGKYSYYFTKKPNPELKIKAFVLDEREGWILKEAIVKNMIVEDSI